MFERLQFWKATETPTTPQPLYLHNTFTKQKELFTPLHGKHVTMYNCGPTVYGKLHIGNYRSYLFADTLKRTLIWNGYMVKQVINLTDVGHLVSDSDEGEDKMTVAMKREQKTATQIADFYIEDFFNTLDTLNVDRSTIHFPRATKYIQEQISLIQKLEEKGFTYTTSDGVYFDTSKFPAYGALGNIDLKGLQEGIRVAANTEKRNPTDFALWKFSNDSEHRQQEWQSPWGVGFPGWHIECSAMAIKLLGETIDIHTGGIDHIPTHHNNEIAQSESATGKHFAQYWLHNAHLMVGGEKISKSLFNTYYIEDLQKKGFDALTIRYFFLGASYRTQMNFTWEGIEAAQHAYNRLATTLAELPSKGGRVNSKYHEEFTKSLNDDLNTPVALSLAWKILEDKSVTDADKRATILAFDSVFGLDLEKKIETVLKNEAAPLPENIRSLARQRQEAREHKDWQKADVLREEIWNAGYEVKDTTLGQEVKKRG